MNYQFYQLIRLNPSILVIGNGLGGVVSGDSFTLTLNSVETITVTAALSIASGGLSTDSIQAIAIKIRDQINTRTTGGDALNLVTAFIDPINLSLVRLISNGPVPVTALATTTNIIIDSGNFIFNDTPPSSDGFFNVPRQTAKTLQAERGTVYIDYGTDPGNQSLSLTIEVMPEFLMKLLFSEYVNNSYADDKYLLYHHRGNYFTVKWKSMTPTYIRTLASTEAESVYEYYLNQGYILETDTDHMDIADLYKVVIEFYSIPAPLFH